VQNTCSAISGSYQSFGLAWAKPALGFYSFSYGDNFNFNFNFNDNTVISGRHYSKYILEML
jgi:hypothetical protein